MTLSPIDWLVVAGYVVMTVGVALHVRRGQRTASDYFLAGRSMPWVVIAVSLYASLFSTVSFVGVPGEAYKHGVLLSLNSLGYALFTPLAIWLFLGYFYRTGQCFTAYEYLEERFNGATRFFGSLIFLVGRSLYGAMVFYAAAQVFEMLVGWPRETIIIAVGMIAVVYSAIGGMKAIMITDVFQTIVIVGGLLAILVRASMLIDFEYGRMWQFAVDQQHGFNDIMTANFFSFDPTVRYTFWVFLALAIMRPLENYGTDQLVVQRLLTSKSYEAAKRAIWAKTIVTPFIMALFWGTGLILFYYYSAVGVPPVGVPSDQIMGHFIVAHLPSPIPGLIAVGLLAALMSTVDSVVGSLSTVTTIDVLQRFLGMCKSESAVISAGKLLTCLWGVVIISLALFLTWISRGKNTLIIEMITVWGSVWGVLLIVMLAGTLTEFATGRAAAIALALGLILNIVLPWKLYIETPQEERISFVWVGLPGMLATAAVLVCVSLYDNFRPRHK